MDGDDYGRAVGTTELLQLPYDSRRLVVVSDRLTKKTEAATQPAPVTDGSGVLSLIAHQPAIGAVAAVGLVGWELARAVRRLRAQGAVVRPIALETAESLRFPPGHPRTNVVYAAHPVDLGVYIPAADFHRFLFQHKVAEAQRLIRALGAETVMVKSVQGWSREAALHFGLSVVEPTSTAPVNASTDLDRTTRAGEEVITTMSLTPQGEPAVPDDLVWFPHEPLWQEIARARIESGLREFSIDVRSSDDFGINAKLKASVDRVGLEAGGKFVEHVETTWRLEGTFTTV